MVVRGGGRRGKREEKRIFLEIHTLQPAALRGMRPPLPEADMDAERRKTHRMAVREQGRAWHEILPALGYAGRGPPPEGGHAGDPKGRTGFGIRQCHAE